MDQCPICGSSCRKLHEARRCVKCGVVRTDFHYNPNIYQAEYADTYVRYQKTPVNVPLNLFRLGLVSRWLKQNDSILDVGCGIGEFVRFAEHYYNCSGYDPNKYATTIARNRVNSPIWSSLNGKGGLVDAITMFDVFEHIEDPKLFLGLMAAKYLSRNSVVVITTPNVEVIPIEDEDSLLRWKHYKPEEHLFLYTKAALSHIFEEIGFKVIHSGNEESEIRPDNPNSDILTFVARRK